MGLNRRERERARRGSRNDSVAQEGDRRKAIALKRIEFYLSQRVDWSQTELDKHDAARVWASLCNHDVDLMNRWFRRGIDPRVYAQVREWLGEGLSIDDLFVEVKGKTVLQHLCDGSSVSYCLSALWWEAKPSQQSVPSQRPPDPPRTWRRRRPG
jgi:hypothetical protein